MEHNHHSVLVVEDNPDIASQLCDFLAEKGFVVDYAKSGRLAIALALENNFDVIILDLSLPDIDGIAVCEHIKQSCSPVPPILMLTARDSIEHKVEGFGVGADDYLTKPFLLEEVYLRCIALTRRHRLHQLKVINVGELSINVSTNEVTRNNQAIKLSSTDFKILCILAEAFPNAVSKRYLVDKIWGEDAPETDAVRSHMYTLRSAVDKPFTYGMIKTVHGIGFRLDIPEL
ncbi:response regulator transcription factor [Thalassotalea sp. LPB0316]|uniref:response regulator transcription factor n=1 Tax=Thalassotalea sp. LPB0316 TaxID=2769490 RepID=UPI001867C782|nr:response regulator transcription factor [Thalassotalea sp. LPB0316]QOL25613.1 response regulator transcription factor [Thalassotalea sp. LPB0316]